ncbi:MAG: Gfo/Idh/MocA family protein [Halobacteriaceae archaeon]
MDELRYGIVGVTGRGGTHAGLAANAAGVELVAGADVVAENVRAFEAEYGATGYEDHGAMLGAEELDAVSVCTPSGTHADIAVDCLEAGVAALVEKPLDVYIDRADRMVEAAEEHRVPLACAFQKRLTPERWTAKRWVEEGRFGDLVLADATVKWHRTQEYYRGWSGTRDLDGGCLMNQAIHSVDLLQWLGGGVEAVHARTDTVAHEMECEDVAVVSLAYESGAYGTIEATTAVRGGEDRLELNGTEGSYNSGTFVRGDEAVEPDLVEPPTGTWTEGLFRDFVAAVREGRDPHVDGEEALRALEVVLAAYASATLDREVRIDELRDLTEYT